MQTHEQYNGVFLSSDSQFAGHLNIAGADSFVQLVGKSFWTLPPETEYVDIHGMLSDGKKASLLECVLHGQTQHRFDENTQFESRFFPHYVIVGEEFIGSDEPVIQAVRYHFDSITRLLSGHNSFRSLRPDPDEMRRILETDHKKFEKMAEEQGWPKHPFNPEISEHPHLLYFSGVREIIACETKIGKILLTNRISQRGRGAAGIGIDNEVTANIEFRKPKTVDAATHALYTLHRLFELSLGHRQRYGRIEIELTHRSKDTEHDLPQTARLYWSLCNVHAEDDSNVILRDALLAPERRPEEFAKVTTGWMNSAEIMGDPRERFATSFFGSFSIDRIVGAANLFDLLPDSYAPKTTETDGSLKEAVTKCRMIFSDLPDSFAKQSVLSALGRIGRASLRDKVYHRANKVLAAAGGKLPELHLPCHHAVLCRNHYVHGSKGAFNYQKHFTEFAFIAETLEFVFAISDLLDLGWDLERWMDEGTSMTHPFSVYTVNYSENIRRLKALIQK
ncbi:hypothetical protein EV681_0012 [Advenella incenata]|uniref:Uncharacterized protein n=1 Tax=Advenella incenata TaxID=267800 RepID=A0A4Q7VPW3_9BURK|nr:HEPN domain-containing protein [Advenella incenata]RZT98237.1 hypothetical protein EV681_0012 [Advenella incenata]